MADYIEREAFKAEIRRLSTHYLNEWDTLGVLAAADRIPAADVRPVVRGGWEEHGEPNEYGKYELWYYSCTRCGAVGVPEFNYCPNCGADMRAEEGE